MVSPCFEKQPLQGKAGDGDDWNGATDEVRGLGATALGRKRGVEENEREAAARVWERVAGQGVGGVFTKGTHGRFSAKWAQNQNFVFFVSKYFGTQGPRRKKYNAFTMRQGLPWTMG